MKFAEETNDTTSSHSEIVMSLVCLQKTCLLCASSPDDVYFISVTVCVCTYVNACKVFGPLGHCDLPLGTGPLGQRYSPLGTGPLGH